MPARAMSGVASLSMRRPASEISPAEVIASPIVQEAYLGVAPKKVEGSAA